MATVKTKCRRPPIDLFLDIFVFTYLLVDFKFCNFNNELST